MTLLRAVAGWASASALLSGCHADGASGVAAAAPVTEPFAAGLLPEPISSGPEEGPGLSAPRCDLADEVGLLQLHSAAAPAGRPRVAEAPPRGLPRQALPQGAAKAAAEPTSTASADPFASRANSGGDGKAFRTLLVIISVTFCALVLLFCWLRSTYPLIYSNNILEGTSPSTPRAGLFGWVQASVSVSLEDCIEPCGLDQALMIEFSSLALKIVSAVGLPMVCVLGPLSWRLGGGGAGRWDHALLSISNVRDGSPLWWVYAVVVWAVAITVHLFLFRAQRMFLKHRFDWLRALPSVRANTVFVEGIPKEYRSDERLFKFFEDIVCGDGNVERAYVVRDTTALAPKIAELRQAELQLREAELTWEKLGRDPHLRPKLGSRLTRWLREPVDGIDFYSRRCSEMRKEVEDERQKLKKAVAQGPEGGALMSSGFVSFHQRTEAELALRLDGLSSNAEEWLIDTPPCATDVRWSDLTQDPTAQASRTLMGYGLISALMIFYVPIVVAATHAAELVNFGPLQPLWRCIAPTAGLKVMVAFLPGLLLNISRKCFNLKAHAWEQRALMEWDFWFQLVYVVLATAVGRDLKGFVLSVCKEPLSVISLLAGELPNCTHFFMSYILISWIANLLDLLRFSPLTKFLFLRRLYTDEEARQLAEPEDQDFFGIGARSARLTIMLTIGLLYGTLSPFINVLILVNFAICRVVHGYLVPFAETKKSGDLGGSFWVGQLNHVFIGLLLYTVAMVGIIDAHSGSHGPVVLAAPSVAFVLWSLYRFHSTMQWERLPYQEITEFQASYARKVFLTQPYVQEECLDSMTAITTGSGGNPKRLKRAITINSETTSALRGLVRVQARDGPGRSESLPAAAPEEDEEHEQPVGARRSLTEPRIR